MATWTAGGWIRAGRADGGRVFKARCLLTDFDTWWSAYPRKVGKLHAMKAYEKARKIAPADVLLAGVERYIQSRPGYADWCHPTTWLNAGRWMDEPDTRPQLSESTTKLIRGAEDFIRGTH